MSDAPEWLRRESSKDPDDVHGDSTVFTLQIRVRRNGAMSVAGDIYQLNYALSVLEAAKDSLCGYHARQKLAGGDALIVPASDTPWDRKVG